MLIFQLCPHVVTAAAFCILIILYALVYVFRGLDRVMLRDLALPEGLEVSHEIVEQSVGRKQPLHNCAFTPVICRHARPHSAPHSPTLVVGHLYLRDSCG
jgi:hypothetical protein